MRIAREALPFLIAPIAVAALLALYSPLLAVAIGAPLLLFVGWFFRDPSRSFSGPEDTIVAAADGRVTAIDEIEEPLLGDGPRPRIVTFLSAFNVHVQRSPWSGEVVAARSVAGRKVAAFRADADRVNESHLTVLRDDRDRLLGVRQIAGLVARRVVPYLEVGDRIERSERLGIIKFGSRVDVILPPGSRLLVTVGDRLTAGETAIATLADASAETPAGTSR